MKTGNETSDLLRPVFAGAVVMLLLSVALAALSAVMIRGGVIPTSRIPITAYGIALIAALIGSVLCGRTAKRAKMPLCLASTAVFLLCAFILRGLFFQTVGEKPWIIPMWVVIGAVLGALIANMQKRR